MHITRGIRTNLKHQLSGRGWILRLRQPSRLARHSFQGIVPMNNTWFTSDFHLGHYTIIRYCNRPFSSTGEMDAAILANLNSKVGENDQLFFLGDFCKGGADQATRYRDRILCKNVHFVEGNHDRAARKISAAFCSWNQLVEVRVGKQGIVLCHYAMRTWHHSSRGVWHLYGHSHGKLRDEPGSLSFDIGVDAHDFQPWNFDEIGTVMETKRRAAAELSDVGKGTHEGL